MKLLVPLKPSNTAYVCAYWAGVTSSLSLILATLVNKSHPKLEFSMPPSPDYTPDIVPTLKKPLKVIHPSFLTPIFVMPFTLLVLGKLTMLSRSPSPFKTLQTKLSVLKQFKIAWKKLGWWQWWRGRDPFWPKSIWRRGWILQLPTRIGPWRIGRRLYGQMKPKSIVWGQMGGNGCGRRLGRAWMRDW